MPLRRATLKLKRLAKTRLCLVAVCAFTALVLLLYAASGRLALIGGNFGGLRTSEFAVVFDAGSTGTRVNVFKFKCPRKKKACTLVPIDDASDGSFHFFAKVDQGLSAFAEFPDGARPGLKLLIEQAFHKIPSAAATSTEIFFGATAGLRLLSEVQQEKLLSLATEELRRRFPQTSSDAVKVIDGKDEALYQWRTIAFLARDEKALVVDMGGGSVQVAFKVLDSERTHNTEEIKYIHTIKPKTDIFVHSWLGFGLKAARMKILEQSEYNACLRTPVSYTYAGKTIEVKVDAEGPSSKKCFEQIEQAMNLGTGCPASLTPCAFDGAWRGPIHPEKHKIFLFSFVFDICKKLRLFHDGSYDNTLTVRNIIEAAERECEHPSRIEDEFLCLDSAYIGTLVHKGLAIHLDKTVRVLNKLLYDGHLFEGAWALGAALNNRK